VVDVDEVVVVLDPGVAPGVHAAASTISAATIPIGTSRVLILLPSPSLRAGYPDGVHMRWLGDTGAASRR